MKKGFTLLELLIVVGILSLLVTFGSAVFSYSQKKSRDTRRSADLENLRVALESYRNDNDIYPAAGNWQNTLRTGGYITQTFADPRPGIYLYYYEQIGGGTDYVLGAFSELGNTCGATYNCGIAPAVNACGYCLGPYGKK